MEEEKQIIHEEPNKKKYNWLNQGGIFLIIIIIGVGLFYWYQIRPSKIYSQCNKEAEENARNLLKEKANLSAGSQYEEFVQKGLFLKNDYDYAYKQCLRVHGIYK